MINTPPIKTIRLWRLNSPSITPDHFGLSQGAWKNPIIFTSRKSKTIRRPTAMPIPHLRTLDWSFSGARLDSSEIYNRLSKPSTAWSRMSIKRVKSVAAIFSMVLDLFFFEEALYHLGLLAWVPYFLQDLIQLYLLHTYLQRNQNILIHSSSELFLE